MEVEGDKEEVEEEGDEEEVEEERVEEELNENENSCAYGTNFVVGWLIVGFLGRS